MSSSPVDVPQLKYGTLVEKETDSNEWIWSDVSNPIFKCSDEVLVNFPFGIFYGSFLQIKIILYAKKISLVFTTGYIFDVLS